MNLISKLVSLFNFGTLANQTPLPAGWYSSFAEAIDAAKNSNKLVLVKVHADWCGYCKNFDQDIVSVPLLSDYLNEHFECARVKEHTSEGKKLKKIHKVVAYPGYLIFRGTDFVGKVRGYRTAAEFLDEIKKLVD